MWEWSSIFVNAISESLASSSRFGLILGQFSKCIFHVFSKSRDRKRDVLYGSIEAENGSKKKENFSNHGGGGFQSFQKQTPLKTFPKSNCKLRIISFYTCRLKGSRRQGIDVDKQKCRASTKGRNLASVPVRRFLKPIFIRVHFVLRPVRLYILAIFWYSLGPSRGAANFVVTTWGMDAITLAIYP